MKSLSGVGLAMSVVFGFLLMALLAELYYLLWWKRRITNARIEDGAAAKELFFMFCGKNPSSSLTMKAQEISIPDNLVCHERQPSTYRGEEDEEGDERSMEAELMRLSGPARFLCTIKEETMEDMELSDDSKRRDDSKGRMVVLESATAAAVETPFLTPLASPPYYTPPLTPANQFWEEPRSDIITEAAASPPPSFKFLRDAEEKAHHHHNRKDSETSSSEEDLPYKDEENGSFITLVFPRSREGEFVSQLSSISSSSQVLPLSSSPPSFISPPSK